MLELVLHQPAADAGPLDFGFRREVFADDPPAVDVLAAADAGEPVYGPEDRHAFEAFRQSEDGRRATTQMMHCLETMERYARDRGEDPIATDIHRLVVVLTSPTPDALQRIYLPDLFTRGKRSLELIAAMLGWLEARGDDRRSGALRCLRRLGEGLRNCGGRTVGELIDAEYGMRQLGDGLKNAVQRVCRNTAKAAIVQALASGGSASDQYQTNPHVVLQFEKRIGLPWAYAPDNDPWFREPDDFPQRVRDCRSAVRQSVTPASVARTLAHECMGKVRRALCKWTDATSTLEGEDWPTLDRTVRKAGSRFGKLEARRFVRGDGVLEPLVLTDDPQAVLSNIRKNLAKVRLVEEKADLTVWQENADATRWALVLKQGDVPSVIEEDDDGPRERTPRPADVLRVLREAASSGALDLPAAGQTPAARPLSDPKILMRVIDGVIAVQTTPPETWESAWLVVPGVLSQVCASLEDEAAARLLGDVAARADAAGSGLTCRALETALHRRLPAAALGLIGAMDLENLRAAWPLVLPHLPQALREGNDAFADACLAALDRLRAAADGVRWTQCRKALNDFRRGLLARWTARATLPPWPDAVLQRLGTLHREGLLSGPVIVALLHADVRLGAFLDFSRIQTSPEPLRQVLACLARAGDELALSPRDMRTLLHPTPDEPGDPGGLGGRPATSPLCSAVMHGQRAHVSTFLSWMTQHASAPWMPPIQALALPDEVLVPRVNRSAVIAGALKAYLEGLVTLHQQGHLSAHGLARLVRVPPVGTPDGLPTGQGFELVRRAVATAGEDGPCAAVLREWRRLAAQQLAGMPPPMDGAAADSGPPASLTVGAAPRNGPATNAPTANGPEAVLPDSRRWTPPQLEEQLVHRFRQGYLGVDELSERLSLSLSSTAARAAGMGALDAERGLGLLKRLHAEGLFSLDQCIALIKPDEWKKEAMSAHWVSVLRAYFDLVAQLAARHGRVVDVDGLLHVQSFDVSVTLAGYCRQLGKAPSPLFNLALDSALLARQRGWIDSTQLCRHLAATHHRTDDSVLLLLLDTTRQTAARADAADDAAAAEAQAIGDNGLRDWLDRLGTAEGGRWLSSGEVVELLGMAHRTREATSMYKAMTQGSARRLSILFDWLVTATATNQVLARRLVPIVQGRNDALDRHGAFEALRLGRVDTLTAWLAGIQRLREADRLSNGDYVTLLVADADGDRRAIEAASDGSLAADDLRPRACAALLREAAGEARSRGWIDADEWQEIVAPLDTPGLISLT